MKYLNIILHVLSIAVLILASLSSPSLRAQNALAIDELEQLLPEQTEKFLPMLHAIEADLLKKNKSEDLMRLYLLESDFHFSKAAYDSMIYTLHKARKKLGGSESNALVPFYLNLSLAYSFKGNLDSLEYWQAQTSKSIDVDSPLYGSFLLIEGLKSQLNSDYNTSIIRILDAIRLFEKAKDSKKLAIAYNNLGYTYGKIGEFEVQLKYLQQAANLNKELGNTFHLILNYNNLGVAYREKNQLEEAQKYYDLAFEELKSLDFPMLMAQNLTNRANIYEKMGDLDKAELLFLQTKSLCEENNIVYGQMLSFINLGNLYRQKKRFELSEEYLKKALELSETLQTKREKALTFERLSWLSRDRQDYKSAYDWQGKFYVLNDSLINESVKKEANALREKYEVEKKENEIIGLSRDNLYQRYTIMLLVTGLLVLALSLQWWRNRHKIEKQEKEKESLQKKHFKEIIEFKDKELTAQAAQLIQMQTQMQEAKDKISEILYESGPLANNSRIQEILKKNPILDIKNNFDIRVTENNEDFFRLLLNNYPDLSPAELKLCAYLRLNLSSKDLSQILNKSIRTIDTSRSAIRKKMNLGPQDNLVSHLINIAAS